MVKQKSRSFLYIAILVFIALVCVLFFLYSSFFYIDKITVTGTEKVSESEVLHLSDIKQGTNIFKVNNRLSSRSIEIHPLIKSAQVIRHLPREISITVVEREQWAVMPYNDNFLILDPEGVCIDRVVNLPQGDYCLITMDKPPERVNLGHAIATQGVKMIEEICRLLPQQDKEQISQFHYESEKNEIIIYTLRGSEIKFGNLERLNEKTALINQVFEMEERLEEEGTGVLQYIDLRFSGQPVLQIK
ncbi:MAG: FtsQ-type POTRA domain-containing protein [Syntrophomonadaceae bacterium]|jgi:cell division protein FtsQ|nr:FtsQ-type POTRA domain-containing protein [Syntrophomonadaceae bacterium]